MCRSYGCELLATELIIRHDQEVDVTRRIEVAHGKRPNQVRPDEVPRAGTLQGVGVLDQKFIEGKERRELAGPRHARGVGDHTSSLLRAERP